MNHQNFTENGNQKFPLSTQALAFMQEQIKLAYGLTDLAGQNIIVREPTVSVPGLVIYDGELLPLTGTRPARLGYIVIAESTETISVEGRYEGNVRTTRVALYAATVRYGGSQQRKSISSFTTLKSISTLMAELDEAKQHHMPKGSIIDWYGTCRAANVPYGFVPCGIVCKGLTEGEVTAEVAAWRNKYPNIITVSSIYSRGWALRITECNGQVVPDLTGRFVVQAGCDYDLGDTGGANEVRLKFKEMPKHRHGNEATSNGHASGSNDDYTNNYSSWAGGSDDNRYGTNGHSGGNIDQRGDEAANAGTAHENRPPYYALYKLIKVI